MLSLIFYVLDAHFGTRARFETGSLSSVHASGRLPAAPVYGAALRVYDTREHTTYLPLP